MSKKEPDIKALSEELRKVREGITDEKVLVGYNTAVAICNKYLAGNEKMIRHIIISIPEEQYKRIINHNEGVYDTMSLPRIVEEGKLLPKGHGKIIDGDMIINSVMSAKDWYSGGDQHYWEGAKAVLDMIELAKPIIKADGEEVEDGTTNV